MARVGDYDFYSYNGSYNSSSINWTTSATFNTDATYHPVVVQGVPLQEAEPETNLEWLRGQVSEICDLARAA